MDRADLVDRVRRYAERKGVALGESLGFRIYGSVFSAENKSSADRTALKGHDRESAHRQERDVYLRLRDCDGTDVRGCNVPLLIDFDDKLLVIEMGLVNRPFVLDFAGAALEQPPDFSDEVLADWEAEKHEQFGTRWAEVKAIPGCLEAFDVFMLDVHPGNISFGDYAPRGRGE